MAKGTYGKTIGTIYDPAVGAPLDSRMMVPTYADLIDVTTWKVDGGTSAESYAYYGMMVYVGNDPDASKNGLYVLKASGSGTTTTDAQSHANWERISQTDATIAALSSAIEDLESASSGDYTSLIAKIDAVSSKTDTNTEGLATVVVDVETISSDLDAAEVAIDTKLNKNFKTYDAGEINSTVVFPANTEAGANVYITGEQIKDFAAAAVSDKGNFVDEAAIKAAFPTPDEGWYATNLETGTTWIVVDGQWTDSGATNGVVSVNGKSGKVTLGAADVDAYTKAQTDSAIASAITDAKSDIANDISTLSTDVQTVSSKVDENAGLIAGIRTDVETVSGKADSNTVEIASLWSANAEVSGKVDANTSSIQTINSQIGAINSTLDTKQDAAINVTVGETEYTTIPAALEALNAADSAASTAIDNKTEKDASNITDTAAWKAKLGYQDATDVSNAISPIATKVDTVSTTADTAKATADQNKTDIGAVSAVVSSNTAALDAKAAKDASNVDAATWRTALDVYSKTEAQPKTITTNIYEGVTTVEGTLGQLKTNIDANDTEILALQNAVGDSTKGLTKSVADNATAISALQGTVTDKANTTDVVLNSEVDTAIPVTASDERVPSTKLVKDQLATKQDNLQYYTEGENYADISAPENGTATISAGSSSIKVDDATKSATLNVSTIYGDVIDDTLSTESNRLPSSKAVSDAITTTKSEINTEVAKKANSIDVIAISSIDSTLDSDSAEKVPSTKAVKAAIDTIKSEVSTAYQFKGSDTYANIKAKTGMEVGDVWNSTTANGTYPAGTNYAWTGEEWDALGGEVDLSSYQTKEITATGIDATTVVGAFEELASGKQDKLEYYTEDFGNVTITSDSERSIIIGDKSAYNVSISLNGNISGTAIDTSLTTSEYKVPTSKAVSDAITTTKSEVSSSLTTEINKKADSETVNTALEGKAAIDGSNLSTENVASWKSKLGFITASEVPEQVQPDWNATEGKAQILNKPDITATENSITVVSKETSTYYTLPANTAVAVSAVNGDIVKCVAGSNVTEFTVGETIVKEIVNGEDMFTFDGASLTSTTDGKAKVITLL